jgi:hypothetical protein
VTSALSSTPAAWTTPVSAQFGDPVRQLPRAFGVRAVPADQEQMLGLPGAHQVLGDRRADRAGAAGDQDRAVGVERGGHVQDELAGVAGLAEVAERLPGAAQRPGTYGRRRQCSLGEQRDQAAQHLADVLGSGVGDQVIGLVADARVLAGDLRGVAYVGLAHLDQPAALAEQAERGVGELTGQAVQHDVDALAAGGGAEGVLEVQVARGGTVRLVDAHCRQDVMFGRARRAVHLRAQMAGDLHGRGAHAAGGRVDQHGLPGLEAAELHQAVPGGQEDHRHRRGRTEVPAVRDRHDRARVGHRPRPERALEQAHHAVAGLQAGDAGTGLDHDARALAAAEHRAARVHAERDQRVAEVDARRTHLDPYLPLGERLLRAGHRDDGLDRVPRLQPEAPRGPGGQVQAGAGAHETGDEGLPGSDRELRLVGRDRLRQRLLDARALVVEVEQQEAAGVLGLRAADEAPHAGAGRVDVAVGVGRLDRAAGDDGQAGAGQGGAGQPVLQQAQHPLDHGRPVAGRYGGEDHVRRADRVQRRMELGAGGDRRRAV